MRYSQLKKIIILFFIAGLSFNLSAQELTFEQQLAALEKMKDKSKAGELIDEMSSSKQLSAQQQILAFHAQARLFHSLGQLDRAILAMKSAQLLAHKSNLKQAKADASKMLGVYHYFKGDNAEALTAYQDSLKYYQSQDTPIKQANLLNNIGLVYAAKADIANAIKKYELAETLYQTHGNEIDQIDIRYNIAGLYLRLNAYDIAIKRYHAVIEQRLAINYFEGIDLVYSDLGITYKQSGQYQFAERYLNEALSYSKKSQSLYNTASQLHNLSEVYNQTNNPEKAIVYAKQAIEIAQQQGHSNALSGALFSLAKAQFNLGEIDASLQNLTLSDQIAKKNSYQNQMNSNLYLFSLIYAAQNKTSVALETHLKYVNQMNKLSNEQLAMSLAKFEAEQLKQKLAQLNANKKVQQLELAQQEQQRIFVMLGIVIILIMISLFFIFKRK